MFAYPNRFWLVILVSLAQAALATAQPLLLPKRMPSEETRRSPLDEKRLAQAKFKAYHADPQELRQAKVEAARMAHDARVREFLARPGTLDFLLNAITRVALAERDLAGQNANEVALWELVWLQTWMTERISRSRPEPDRGSLNAYAQSRYYRLHAQLELLRARPSLRNRLSFRRWS